MNRREFLATALPAGVSAAQTTTPNGIDRMVGIQIPAVSFLDEGVEAVLDTVQSRGRVNTVFLIAYSYAHGLTGHRGGSSLRTLSEWNRDEVELNSDSCARWDCGPKVHHQRDLGSHGQNREIRMNVGVGETRNLAVEERFCPRIHPFGSGLVAVW